MKKKLIIFFLSIFPILIVYKITENSTFNYLSIGDDLAKGHTPFDTYDSSYTDYVYDYIKQNHKNAELNKDYIKEDLRIKDLIEEIKNPSPYSSKNLAQALKKADIITLSIGTEELFSKLRSTYSLKELECKNIDSLYENITLLLKEIRKITKKKIYIVGYYNPIKITAENENNLDNIFNYIDALYKSIEEEYNIKYIEINDEFKNNPLYMPNQNNAFPSLHGYKYIANQIIKEIES